jgi:tetratricopeptide (TPR) repeat protein
MRVRVAVLLLCLCFFSAAACAQRALNAPGMQSNTISGQVTDSNGKAVSNARVEVHDLSNGLVVQSAYTSTSGSYEFDGLPNGYYEVVATANLAEARDRTDLGAMGNALINLRMPAPQDSIGSNAATVSIAQYKVPGKARSEYKKAQDSLDKKRFDEAQKHLAKALEIYPQFAEALTLRAIISMDQQQTDAALNDLDASVKIDPTYPTAYFVQGAIYNTLSKFPEAVSSIERGLALAPNSWQGYFELGKAQIGKAEYEKGLRSLDRAQAAAPDGYTLIHLVKAHALLAMKNYNDAMGELQAFLDKNPSAPETQAAKQMMEQAKAFAMAQR